MRYPISKSGLKEEVEKYWYIASKFGEERDGYFHSGVDWNLKTGGDSDLEQPISASSEGKIAYYHSKSHVNYGFGKHNVLEVNTPFGIRWFHHCHCGNDDFIENVKDVSEGDLIARIGKSGTSYAHLHFSIFKIDPIKLARGIDTIANTRKQLNDWWEDPEAR